MAIFKAKTAILFFFLFFRPIKKLKSEIIRPTLPLPLLSHLEIKKLN